MREITKSIMKERTEPLLSLQKSTTIPVKKTPTQAEAFQKVVFLEYPTRPKKLNATNIDAYTKGFPENKANLPFNLVYSKKVVPFISKSISNL